MRRLCALTASTAAVMIAVAVPGYMSPGYVSAQPGGVPDVSGLADVTTNFTVSTGRGAHAALFATPDGVACGAGPQGAHCDGNFPGLADIPLSDNSAGPCEVGSAVLDAGSAQIGRHRWACPEPSGRPVLGAGQRVTMGNVTCGVLAGDVTVCTNGPHGFVLQPSGSWNF